MSEFNFKSQICTTKEQSERLLALGLKKETADCNLTNYSLKGKGYQDGWKVGTVPYCKVLEEWNKFAKDSCWELIPAWSLHRLIEMCPCDVEISGIWVYAERSYEFREKDNVYDNLIDLIKSIIKEGYFNKEYLEDGNC